MVENVKTWAELYVLKNAIEASLESQDSQQYWKWTEQNLLSCWRWTEHNLLSWVDFSCSKSQSEFRYF